MKTITYTFADGTTSTVEVTDELYQQYEEMEKADALAERRETRRSQSLEKSLENGWDVVDPSADVFADVEKKETYAKLYAAIATLTPAQQLLIKKVFWEGKTQTEIAEQEGVARCSINKRLTRILQKLKKFLLETANNGNFRGY